MNSKVRRVDAPQKVCGSAKYVSDLGGKMYCAKVLHATIANGWVSHINTTQAAALPGVIRIVTCFDIPEHSFSTRGHIFTATTEGETNEICNRQLLNRRVRFYGDDIAVVVAVDALTAQQALDKIHVTYCALPPILDVFQAMSSTQPPLHKEFPHNIMAHTTHQDGDFNSAISAKGLLRVEGWYSTPIVQHCHLENISSYAYMDGDRIVVVSSTQIPHLLQQLVAAALQLPPSKIRIIKPYVGGAFGNKEEALYEPLNAYLTTLLNGAPVRLELTREETFICTRVRHAIHYHIVSYVYPDGRCAARSVEAYCNQGAYTSHGHVVTMGCLRPLRMLYPCDAYRADLYTVFTNTPTAGAMRGYGAPQFDFAIESHIDDIAKKLQMDPFKFRMKNLLRPGTTDIASGYVYQKEDSLRRCIEKGAALIRYTPRISHQNDGTLRGIGMAVGLYGTGTYPGGLEESCCRMALTQDGRIRLQLGEVELGQGADTAFTQMAAEELGVNTSQIDIISTQDTDVTPYGSGAYSSRQTYVASFSIHKAGRTLHDRILSYASNMLQEPVDQLKIYNDAIYQGELYRCSLAEVAQYVAQDQAMPRHITAEESALIQSNALSFFCSFAEVEIDPALCRLKVIKIVNVHDSGRIINPQLAEAQVHGGVSMSLGMGVSEQLLFDKKTGKPLNGNLLDYKLLTALDHPDIVVSFVSGIEASSPFGVKSLGEPPTITPAPAVRNAVLAATGLAINQIPITPQRLYEAFRNTGIFSNDLRT